MATISPATQRSASRLQRGRVAAFKEFRADVESGAFPEEKHLVPIAEAELEAFMKALPNEDDANRTSR